MWAFFHTAADGEQIGVHEILLYEYQRLKEKSSIDDTNKKCFGRYSNYKRTFWQSSSEFPV